MVTKSINIYDIISTIQAKKEAFRIQPAHVTFLEVKAEIEGVEDGELYALLGAEVDGGLIRQVRTINGYAYAVAEE